ncbi:hypothetical protein Ddye_028687 [Dipteronia dyeriana]|uniref:Uncharacterized protein n=1 Tax=Dipteronia dyeriana TaxID=168575 RepID=A0AAD9TDT0_9ROSI|nr:hypothetical protein Ddye_028687 [Dipteronia dyeriana]
MVAREFINDYEPVVVLPEDSNGFQGYFDDHRDDHEEEEETLSLCDLAVSSNAEDYYWNELSYKEDHNDEDEDFFEFSSEDFTASSSYPKPNQNIIFCGKIIPYRGEDQVVDHDHDHQTQNQNNSTNDLKLQNPKKSLNIFPRKSKKEKHGNDFKFDFSMKKVSTMPTSTATTLKSRWYLLAFGSFGKGSGLSKRMELRDIKSRQSRRSKVAAPTATMFQLNIGGFGGGDKLAKTRGDEKRSGSKGLWRLLKILGVKVRDRML